MKKKQSKSASSQRWVARQSRDVYVRKAKETKQRSRAVFKLEQLDQKDRLFRAGQNVLDLGSAPGGWSQHLARKIGTSGRVVAVDLLEMAPIFGVEFVQGDFLDTRIAQGILDKFEGEPVDAVVSDMAPNLSGIRDRDQARSQELVEAALSIAVQILKPGGLMVVKIFDGGSGKTLIEEFKNRFSSVVIRKPDASRSGSSECYVVAKGYNHAL